MSEKQEEAMKQDMNDVLEQALEDAQRQADHEAKEKKGDKKCCGGKCKNHENKESCDNTNRIEELTSTLQHLQADFDNYRKRTEKERLEVKALFKKDFLTRMLPTIDMFDLAIKHKDNHDEFVKGIEMIYAQFKGTLETEGIEEITDNDTFDALKHEAVLTEDGEDGKILEVLQKGYSLNGDVIRCARVKVGKKETQ